MKIDQAAIFADYCWKINVLDLVDNQELIDYAYKIQSEKESIHVSNQHGYHSPPLKLGLECDQKLKKLQDQIIPFSKKILLDKFYNDESKLSYLLEGWVNISGKYAYNEPHIHGGNVLLSIVYYAKTVDNGGTFYFAMDKLKGDKLSEFRIDKKSTSFTSFFGIKPEPGDLICFPGWVEHGVHPNMDDKDRISYAFNLRVKYENS